MDYWTPDPIVAWRAWTLQDIPGHAGALMGVRKPWWKSTMEADHGGLHASPHPDCLCGINAVKEIPLDWLLNPPSARLVWTDTVFGRVELTGIVDEYERGYRASHARIIDLVVVTDYQPSWTVEQLSTRYGVPVRRETWDGPFVTQWKEHHGYREEDTSDHRDAGTVGRTFAPGAPPTGAVIALASALARAGIPYKKRGAGARLRDWILRHEFKFVVGLNVAYFAFLLWWVIAWSR